MEDLTAKKYLESKGLCDHDYMDSGMINHISEMMEEYHQAKLHLLNLPVVVGQSEQLKPLSPNECEQCGVLIDHRLNECGDCGL